MRINERFEDLMAENQQLKDRIIRLEMKTEVLEEVLKELKAADLPDEAGTEKKPARTSRAKKTT